MHHIKLSEWMEKHKFWWEMMTEQKNEEKNQIQSWVQFNKQAAKQCIRLRINEYSKYNYT